MTGSKPHSTLEDFDVLETFLISAGASNSRKDALKRIEEQLEALREALRAIRDCRGAVNETVESKMRRIAADAMAPNPAKEPSDAQT